MPPQHPPGSEGSRRDGCGTGDRIGARGGGRPGRAEIDHPSRRLAWRSAGGPPPTGTWTGSAVVTREAAPVRNTAPPLEGAAPVRSAAPVRGSVPLGALQSGSAAPNQWGAMPTDGVVHPRQQAQMRIGCMQQRFDSTYPAWAACSVRAVCPYVGGCSRPRTAGPRAGCEKAAPARSTQSTNPSNTTRPITPCEPPRLEGANLLIGPARTCCTRDRPLSSCRYSRRAYCRSGQPRFARTTMPMRSTIASSTQLPSSAAKRGCTGASSKRQSKPRGSRAAGG